MAGMQRQQKCSLFICSLISREMTCDWTKPKPRISHCGVRREGLRGIRLKLLLLYAVCSSSLLGF